MIKWNAIEDLHVVSNLRKIVRKWFDCDLFYLDDKGRLTGQKILADDSQWRGPIDLQFKNTNGLQCFVHDCEELAEKAVEIQPLVPTMIDTSVPLLKGILVRIDYQGANCGSILAYPVILDNYTYSEMNELKNFFLDNHISEFDINTIFNQVKLIDDQKLNYLKDLTAYVGNEIITFHQELDSRDQQIMELNTELGKRYRYHSMIGKSKKMQQVYKMLDKISKSEASVLVQGENGTGKELIAKAIHYQSPRSGHVFLAVDCSAFNEQLLDSELFGHIKGAFTGAIRDKKGLFEMADGGTLFLDEIGNISLTMQVKLLRVLQEGTFLPIGAEKPKHVDVRIIAATNRDLKSLLKEGKIREDFYYRINVLNISLPPLRDRKEDIPLLVDHFLQQRCLEIGKSIPPISHKIMEKLLDYSWPGNVRELEHEIERFLVLSNGDKNIQFEFLSPKIQNYGGPSLSFKGIKTDGKLKDSLEELEEIIIKEGLKRCNYNKSRLAKELGISRAGLIIKVEKYGLDKRKKVLEAA